MSITLDAITLPEDLVWRDEYDWSNVTQNVKRSLTGSLIIQEVSQTKGRSITLEGSQDSGWTDKTTLDALMAKANVVDTVMTLTFHGTAYNVMFSRSGNGSPVSAKQIYDLSNPGAEDNYSVAIKFIEV